MLSLQLFEYAMTAATEMTVFIFTDFFFLYLF